jgi:hypothetical protein
MEANKELEAYLASLELLPANWRIAELKALASALVKACDGIPADQLTVEETAALKRIKDSL